MSWSPQQERAIADVQAWLKDPRGKQVFRLFGYAGTGKTTLAKELAATVKGTVLYATFTGKAALVLRKKGCEGASTIHSLIYKVDVNERTGEATFSINPESDLSDAKLLIVDEVSMVGEELAKDLLTFGKRILVLGDPAQLPPVKDEGFFINCAPDVMLTEVHRQAYTINSKVYQNKFPDLDFGRLVYVDSSAPEWTPGIITFMSSTVGAARWYSSGAKDMAKADATMDKGQVNVHMAGVGYGYDLEEIGQAQLLGMDLSGSKALAARRAYTEFMWNVTLSPLRPPSR